jgi:VanZ family protein
MYTLRGIGITFTWIIVLVWMFIIFNLSAQPANQSSKLSEGVAETILETVEKVAPGVEFRMGNINHITRKNAHFFIYLVLSLLVSNALKKSGLTSSNFFNCTLVICILYAISDEIHQLFVPGRSGQVKDVLIDSAGAMTGIGLYGLVLYSFKKPR